MQVFKCCTLINKCAIHNFLMQEVGRLLKNEIVIARYQNFLLGWYFFEPLQEGSIHVDHLFNDLASVVKVPRMNK